MSFKLTGADQMRRRLQQIAKKVPDRLAAALYVEAEKISTDSARNYVPVREGVLRASRYVKKPEIKGRAVSVEIGYGGAASAYAIAVHENPSRYDPPSWEGVTVTFRPAGRGPKYLERPLKEALKGMAERLAAEIDIEKI